MADTKVSSLNEADAKESLSLYVVDPNEATAANRSKQITVGDLINAIMVMDGDVVTFNNEVVFKE